MAERIVRETGDDILRKISKPVKSMTDRTQELIDDMIETLHIYDGVGLAGVQVGILKRIAILWVPDPYDEETPEEERNDKTHTFGKEVVIINPTWEAIGEETQIGNEGCLSVPGKYGTVIRPEHVLLKALDRDMQPFELEAEGLLARAICHECDHMDGILYTDKVEGELHDNSDDEEYDDDYEEVLYDED